MNATATNSPDLEVKDAQLIFGAVWRELEGLFGRSKMRFPRELILLGGAPGAGKGTNSDFIRKVRTIDAPPLVISQLLDTPEALAVKARGAMESPNIRTVRCLTAFRARRCRWSASSCSLMR